MVLHPWVSGDRGARLSGAAELWCVAVLEPRELHALRRRVQRCESSQRIHFLCLALYDDSGIPGYTAAEDSRPRPSLADTAPRAARADGPSTRPRAARAIAFGLAAAVAGSVGYFAVVAMTGLEFGILAVAVGYAVGIAVKKGSRSRGGWAYQTLAVVLTYFAIAATYVPLVAKEIQ